jgi:hypothetical protein
VARKDTLLARNAAAIPEATTDFILNIAPIHFDDTALQVGVLHVQNRRQLAALQTEHGLTHVFHHDNGTKVLCVPYHQSRGAHNLPEGATPEMVRLSEQPELCATLTRNSLLGYLHRRGRPSSSGDPIVIIGNESNENLLEAAIAFPAWLAVRPRYHLLVRAFNFAEQPPFVGLTLDVGVQYVIDVTCDELVAGGFSLSGLHVGRWSVQEDVRLAPRFVMAGRADQVIDGQLLLAGSPARLSAIPASEAYLQPSRLNFQRCLHHVFREHSRRVEPELDKQIAKFLSGPKRLRKSQGIVERFSQLKLPMSPGVNFTIAPFLAQNPDTKKLPTENASTFPAIQFVAKTVYGFDAEGQNTHLSKERGLDEHGPYSTGNIPAQPQICIIGQSYRRDQLEATLHKWLHGIASTKREKSLFPNGLIGKYRLGDIDLQFFPVNGDTAEAYRRTTRAVIQQQHQRGCRWDLAIVQTNELMHNLEAAQNPFLAAEGILLEHQIPSQEFPIENAKLRDRALSHLLNSMALKAFCQMGGVPWVLQTNHSNTHEIVIGLDHAILNEDDLPENQTRCVINTVFTGDGNYLFASVSSPVAAGHYSEALLSTLSATLEKVLPLPIGQVSRPARIVIHARGSMVTQELRTAFQAVFPFQQDGGEVALLHVVEEHPILLFDQKQRGVQHYPSQLTQGAWAPARGNYLPLSNREALLFLSAAKEMKSLQEGMPRPLFLNLVARSNFSDMHYLVQQMSAFSSHSWQSFSPAPLPVSLFYTELIKRKLGQSIKLIDRNLDLLRDQPQENLWFL